MAGRFSLAGLLMAAALAAGGAQAGEAGFGGAFEVHVGGLRALEMEVDGRFEGERYDVAVDLRTAGFLAALFEATVEARTEGRVEAADASARRLAPRRFSASSRNSRKDRDIELSWNGPAPVVRVEPAFDPEPWRVDPAKQAGTIDPLTAVALAFAPVPRTALCNRTVEVFDGRRRYAIDLGEPEETNAEGGIACPALYRRVAGFEPDLMERMPEWPFRVFFAETAPGLWGVMRAEGDTSFGMAVLRRRDDAEPS